MTVKNSFYIFLSMLGITIAFTFVGYLLFKESTDFVDVFTTLISIFSLMSGDSVLDMLIELKKYEYVGFIYISAVVVFFVFFF